MSKINVALIGYGFSGREFHLPPLSFNKSYCVKKVMTRSPINQKDLLKAYPDVEIITTFEDAVNDSNIDMVVIATPNDVHYEYTKHALLAKKHVVCEKPFVENIKDALYLFKLAQKNNVLLRVFHNRKYDGDIITAKELLETKDFGKLLSFSTRFDRYLPEVSENWRFKKTDMAGIFYDLAPHLVHHCLDLFGMPKMVENKLFYDREKALVDDHFEMCLTYDDGFVCYLGAEMLERNPKPRIEIIGTNKSYFKYGYDTPDSSHKKTDELYQKELLRSELIDNNLEVKKIPIYIGQHYEFYNKVALDINTNNFIDEDMDLALGVILIMEQALKSNKTQKSIEINKTW